jgi:hypothetical protein
MRYTYLMETTLQADEKGGLHLPASLLPQAEPLATYQVHETNGQIVISRKESQGAEPPPFWKTATPEERLAALREWLSKVQTPACLSDYAVSRESIYD